MVTAANCVCGKPAPGAFLCKACIRRLEQRYAELPALMGDLLVTLTRQDNIGEASGGERTKGAAPPLTVSLPAADVFADITRNLARTVAHLVDLGQRIPCGCGHAHSQHYTVIPFVRSCWWRRCRCAGYHPTDRFTAVQMAPWLLHRIKVIAADPEAPRILEGMDDVRERLICVINIPEDLRSFPVGMCPELDDQGAQCPGEIRAHIPDPKSGKRAQMRCKVCGVVYEPWQWARAGKRIRPRPRPPVPGVDPETGLLPPVAEGSRKGGRARLAYGTDGIDDQVVNGRLT